MRGKDGPFVAMTKTELITVMAAILKAADPKYPFHTVIGQAYEILHAVKEIENAGEYKNQTNGGAMIAISFNWRDLWIGVYVSKDRKTVFICPLPCVVIGIGPDAKTRLHGT